jgi:hypothetical protein
MRQERWLLPSIYLVGDLILSGSVTGSRRFRCRGRSKPGYGLGPDFVPTIYLIVCQVVWSLHILYAGL